jgi:histone deacetylase complex regulatory component SIN3
LTASYNGWVNGDTSASLTTLPSISTPASAASHVGSYAITVRGAASSDYAISYVTGTLSVTPATLTITADNKTKVYGAALPTLTASYNGWVNGDTSASLTTLPSISTPATAASHVGSYAITASGAASGDYAISYVFGSMSVTPAALTITANNQTKLYGAALPTLTASYTGWVNGDTSASLTALPSIRTIASTASHVGSYAITASGAVSSDYAISYVTGSLSITPAALTITADNKTKVYGSGLPVLTASYAGWVNGDTPASLTTLPSLSTTASASSHVGSYAITTGGAASSDYAISYVTGTLSITPAALTITASNQTKVYGAALPTLTASYNGWVNGDTPASLTTLPSIRTTATAASHVGSYAITASGAGSSDYVISYVFGSLSVTPAALTITASNQTKFYGAALPTLTASYTGWVNGDTPASLATMPSISTSASAASHVGSYAITVSGAAASDYAISYVFGNLSITPAALTITANNQTKVYGAALPNLTAAYNGWVNGDTAASLATLPSISTTASAASHVGSYAITVAGAASSDYAISYVSGSLNVTPAALTITANDTTKLYGAAVPALTATYRGLVNGDSAASLTTPPTLNTAATASSHVRTGGYAINASGANDPDYMISYLPGTLTITPAPLTITASNASKIYGAALPALTASYTGFVNGESAASLVARPVLATTAAASSPVVPSGYAIIASGASDPDYSISYQPGTLLVTPASLTITANNARMVQGAAVPPLSASYRGFVNGDSPASLAVKPTVTTAATSRSPAGTYPIVVGGASSPNYAINYANGILVVTPAPVKVLKISIQAIRLGNSTKTTQVIVVQFSGAMNPASAQSISNYTLTTIPTNKSQKSQSVALAQAQYSAKTNTVTLITRKPLVLNPPIRLTLNAARLHDRYGRPLSGKSVATLSKSGVSF